jgi:membrane-bound serine protease (ClpP class)
VVTVSPNLVTLAFFLFFIRKIWAARMRPAFSGAESLVGAQGEAREELAPEGLVFVAGALWKAVAASNPIHAGSAVKIVGRKGLQLEVVAGENGAVKEEK